MPYIRRSDKRVAKGEARDASSFLLPDSKREMRVRSITPGENSKVPTFKNIKFLIKNS